MMAVLSRRGAATLVPTSIPAVGLLQRRCACGGTPGPDGECAECRRKRLQRRAAGAALREAAAAPDIVHEVLRTPGQPLDTRTRAFMEPRFGHDFGRVRVHTDRRAAGSARAVGALAYTVGGNVVFDSGRYAPETDQGRRLLAHELTHVVQQSATVAPPERLSTGEADGIAEREATLVSEAAAAGISGHVACRVPGRLVQRAGPAAAAAPVAVSVLVKRCIIGALVGAAVDAALQYGQHLWRLRRWPWERARESWEAYRHNWCLSVLSAVLGCLGGVAAARWIEPYLRGRFPSRLGGAAGGTLLGRLLLWLATQGVLAPRFVVKWLGKMRCISLDEAEALHPGITVEEGLAQASEAGEAGRLEPEVAA